MKTQNLTVTFPEHGKMILTNNAGSTFTSTSEELNDFIRSSEYTDKDKPKNISEEEWNKTGVPN